MVNKNEEKEKNEKMEIESDNNSKNTRASVKKLSNNSKNQMMEIFNEEENKNNSDINNNKSSLSLIEDKKEEEEKSIIKRPPINLNNKKYLPLSASMIAQTLLSHKRYFDKKGEEFLNNNNNSMQNIKISVNSFNENKVKKINEGDFHNNLFFKDKQIKLLSEQNELLNKKQNDNNTERNEANSIKIKIYDLGTIRLMINFETPIVADFAFYGPKNTDFFKKYEILKFQPKDIMDEIKANFDRDIFGFLKNGNFIKGHKILVSYLRFFEKRVYFYRNENFKMNIYIFGNGKIKNLILTKCGINLNENLLTFLIKSDFNNS